MKSRINKESVENILDFAENNGLGVECIEGTLQDNYFIMLDKNMGIDGEEPKKYVILLETPLNGWESGHTLITTDSDDEYSKLYDELTGDEMAG